MNCWNITKQQGWKCTQQTDQGLQIREPQQTFWGVTHGGSEIPAVDLTDTELSPHQFSQAKELLSEFSDVFSQNDRDYGRANLITHSIKTENTSPIRKTPYRLPQAYREAGEETDSGNV